MNEALNTYVLPRDVVWTFLLHVQLDFIIGQVILVNGDEVTIMKNQCR
ncbi:hypothetical protein HMPREF1527_01442 [Atopobium sp. oral taxon 199 str. F0494]|nr:hypothetical protein HMPREF1527_01442 [Atopobium sp. oral taxon 199 str. F0494]